MNRFTFSFFFVLSFAFLAGAETFAQSKPNIVVMLADDMGFGEVQHLNPKRGKIATPRLDAIAKSGMVFMDAHSASSVCTPTRYGLLTGRYAWRTRLQDGVVTGGESLIAEDRVTMAKMLKDQGYHTAIIGKWHLGILYDGKENKEKGLPVGTKITHGPIDRGGFDFFRGFHHARQMDLWIEDDVVTRRMKAIDMLPELTKASVEYINGRKDNEQPFFLYVPWSAPHSPVLPSPEWQGKSGLNPHADFVMQTDDCFGQIMDALEANGFSENTLVICSSDNGTSGPTSKMGMLKKNGHFSSGDLRGAKADIWDGGHRVPFIAHWPGTIEPGSVCENLVCLNDLFATTAEVVGYEVPDDAGEDSVSMLSLLKGGEEATRHDLIHHSITGQFSIRLDNMKLILCPGSGGWSQPKDQRAIKENLPQFQLYDMSEDLGEESNLFKSDGDTQVRELMGLLKTQVEDGRSTPGEKQSNDVKVNFLKLFSRR